MSAAKNASGALELCFPKDVYPGELVDEAAKVYARFGTLDREERESAWVIQVSASTPARAARLAGELGNYALGLTIDRRGTSADDGSDGGVDDESQSNEEAS